MSTTPTQPNVVSRRGSRRERPIPFRAPMVRAIRDGRKTQTRRVIKPQPSPCGLRKLKPSDISAYGFNPLKWYGADPFTESTSCPYGSAGDRLWVRETWSKLLSGQIWYRADGHSINDGHWKPSIFMPRWASRITLEIVAVRVERLQDISNEDCWAEGLPPNCEFGNRTWYADLWESINGRGSWDLNPWVWVIEFKAANP